MNNTKHHLSFELFLPVLYQDMCDIPAFVALIGLSFGIGLFLPNALCHTPMIKTRLPLF